MRQHNGRWFDLRGTRPLRRWLVGRAVALNATIVFLGSLVYYGLCLFPGLGGELNAGDSVKFQILGHSPIMVHGPGYPIVLLLATGVRSLALPLPDWWVLTFALSPVPAAIANVLAFLIVRRVTGNIVLGVAAALLLGSAGLMAVQATEAEVYSLTLAFVLACLFLLMLFVETKRLGYFVSACAVYAFSFGNHLMMIMLLPVFVWVAAAHWRLVFRLRTIAVISSFIVLGACQYLYLFYVAHSPETAYSEYMPLPPDAMAFIHYILGTYFGELYGSGLTSTRTLDALIQTLRSAHPWLSMPLIAAGALLFLAGWNRRDAGWRGIAILYGGALAFVPFTLWYGAYDIQAFHLPVMAPLLVAAVAALGWRLRLQPAILNIVAVLLLTIGLARAGYTSVLLTEREPLYTGLKPAVEQMVAQSSVDMPIVAMSYDLRMVMLYHQLRGDPVQPAIYRLHWRAVAEVKDRPVVGGIVVPTDGYQFVRWIEYRRPDMRCRTEKIDRPEGAKWPAYAFECRSEQTAQ